MRGCKFITKLDEGGTLQFDSRAPVNFAEIVARFDRQGVCYLMRRLEVTETKLVYGLCLANAGRNRLFIEGRFL